SGSQGADTRGVRPEPASSVRLTILRRKAIPARTSSHRFLSFSCNGQASCTSQANGGLHRRFKALRRLSARSRKKVREGRDSHDGGLHRKGVSLTRFEARRHTDSRKKWTGLLVD